MKFQNIVYVQKKANQKAHRAMLCDSMVERIIRRYRS